MIEVEYKFEVTSLKELKRRLSELKIKQVSNWRTVDRYYDTRNLELQKQGCLLRERRKGGKILSTIKTKRLSSVSVTRPELEREGTLKEFYSDARKFAAEHCTKLPGLKALLPFCAIEKEVEGYVKDNINITIDKNVVGTLGGTRYNLGTFVELEVLSDKEVGPIEKRIRELAKELPIRLVTATYQDMLLEKAENKK